MDILDNFRCKLDEDIEDKYSNYSEQQVIKISTPYNELTKEYDGCYQLICFLCYSKQCLYA